MKSRVEIKKLARFKLKDNGKIARLLASSFSFAVSGFVLNHPILVQEKNAGEGAETEQLDIAPEMDFSHLEEEGM